MEKILDDDESKKIAKTEAKILDDEGSKILKNLEKTFEFVYIYLSLILATGPLKRLIIDYHISL